MSSECQTHEAEAAERSVKTDSLSDHCQECVDQLLSISLWSFVHWWSLLWSVSSCLKQIHHSPPVEHTEDRCVSPDPSDQNLPSLQLRRNSWTLRHDRSRTILSSHHRTGSNTDSLSSSRWWFKLLFYQLCSGRKQQIWFHCTHDLRQRSEPADLSDWGDSSHPWVMCFCVVQQDLSRAMVRRSHSDRDTPQALLWRTRTGLCETEQRKQESDAQTLPAGTH